MAVPQLAVRARVGPRAVAAGVAVALWLATVSAPSTEAAGPASFTARPYPTSLGGELLPDALEPRNEYGLDVAIRGPTVVVGEHDHGSDTGAAEVFTLSGGRWSRTATLTAARSTGVSEFGHTVATDGATVAVGAHTSDADGRPRTGAAFVYVRGGASWIQQTELVSTDAAPGDRFGHALAVDGDTLVVGADSHDSAGNDAGAAYVFTRSASEWTQQAKLVAGDAGDGDRFGYVAALDHGTAIVSAHLDDEAGRDAGAAYIFVRTGDRWTQQAKLIPSGADRFDYSGFHVALSDDTAVLGAHLDDEAGVDAGAAYVFVRRGTAWIEEARLTAPGLRAGDRFGFRVAISGDTALIGAPLDDDEGTDAGTAYAFTRTAGEWRYAGQLTSDSPSAGDDLARALAVDPPYAVLGALGDDGGGTDAGAAIVEDLLHAAAGSTYTVSTDSSRTLDRSQPYGRGATVTWDLDGDDVFGETGTAAARGAEVGVTPTFSAAGLAPGTVVQVVQRVAGAIGTVTDTATVLVTPTGCEDDVPSHPFTDLAGNVHASSVACAVWWGLIRGSSPTTYAPTADLTRGQLASLLVRLLTSADVVIPTAPRNAFTDDDRSTHARSIDQLAALGVFSGLADGRSGHGTTITREQVATLVARTLETAGIPLPAHPPDAFADDEGSTHERALDQLAAVGVYRGLGDGTSGARGLLRRDQAASLVTRALVTWISSR